MVTKGLMGACAFLFLGFAYASASIQNATTPVRDIVVQSQVVSRDMDVLKKISTEFAQSYRFANSTLYYKEPNLMRLESKAGAVTVVYIINGDKKRLNAGLIRKTWNVAKEPRQRQSVLAIGLLAPSYLNLFTVTPAGNETVAGVKADVYTLRYKVEPQGSYLKLSVDPEKRVVVRHRQFMKNDQLKYEIRFLKPKPFGGIWVPTQSEVYNGEGQKGATTQITSVKVNAGIASSQFQL